MTHIVPPKPGHYPTPPSDEGDVGKDEGPIKEYVSLSSRVVADGFDGEQARFCMLLRPWVGAGAKPVDISAWPSEVLSKKDLTGESIPLRMIPLPSNLPTVKEEAEKEIRTLANQEAKLAHLQAEAKPAHAVDVDQARIDRLWRRMMNPDGAGSEFWKLLTTTLACPPPENKCSAYLPTPHGPASLMFTLQRGRALLEAIASPDSPLAMRVNSAAQLSLARPWYQEERPTRLASASPDFAIPTPDLASPEHEEFWLAPYRKRTAALLAGETPQPIWPDARTMARTILAGDLPAAGTMECVHAAHHLTTPDGHAAVYCASPDDNLATAQRRLGALLSLPTLQRLFGFAFDLKVKKRDMIDALSKLSGSDATPFVALAPVDADGSWTLARFEPNRSIFCPASWEEVCGDMGKAPITHGLRNLARRDDDNNPVYDIITIDPALASESSINNMAAQKASKEKGSALAPVERSQPVLHNGGLRVIEAKDGAADEKPTKCPSHDIIEDANALKIGDRLMVGIEVREGEVLWRSPDYRVIEFCDPTPGKGIDPKWVEAELSRRHLKADGIRRVQLDGAMAMSARQQVVDPMASEARKPPDDPVAKAAIKIIEDSTVALWGSDPAGVAPPEFDQKTRKAITKKTMPVIEELDITRHFRSPSHRQKHDMSVLSPTLRFGWSYYTALAPVFEGGGSLTPDDVARISKRVPAVSLPPIKGSSGKLKGRRFLRHERINAPMAVLLETDVPTLTKLVPPQLSPDMYVRTTREKGRLVASTRRLIVPPPIPLQFAMLHDVLRNTGNNVTVPKQGLSGLSLMGAQDKTDDQKPNRAHIGEISSKSRYVYYPDPAASVMVFGLKLPAEAGLESAPFIEDPVAIPVGARTWPDKSVGELSPWPNVVPIHLEVKAVPAYPDDHAARKPRIDSKGPRWLAPDGKLSEKAKGNAVKVHLVEISLAPGEVLALQAWCAPTVAQLTEWFDAIESAGLLLIAETTRKTDPHAACIGILKKQLNKDLPADLKHNEEEATKACLGAGGLTTPPRKTVQTIAGLVYRELLLKPNAVLASPLTMRLTHAVDDCLLSKPELGADIAITRRIFATADAADAAKTTDPAQSKPTTSVAAQTPADFLNNTPISEWGLSSTQEGATSTLIGGHICFDPASTGGLLIEALSAAPFDDSLDNPAMGLTREQRLRGDFVPIETKDPKKKEAENAKPFGFFVNSGGAVTFTEKQVPLLRLDGLPLPQDGRSGPRHYSLQELMAGAWGDAHPFGLALRAALPAALHCSGARRLKLKVTPINRHSGLLLSDHDHPAPESVAREIWLPATTRPAPPVIDHVSVALSHKPIKMLTNTDGSFTVGVEQSCVFTIWHARPFFSSGDGEKIALVLWPPGLFARGMTLDEKGQEILPKKADEAPAFYDEDLGPGGPYVTRWGADPLAGDDVPQSKFPTGPLIDPSRLSSAGERIPRAFMPVPISNQTWAASDQTDAKQQDQAGSPKNATAEQTPVAFMAVALQAFGPRFDPIRELWYFHVTLKTDPLAFPRVRLGLVRYQPHAREDDVPFDGSEPVRLRVSTPVKQWVKPLPGRKATVTYHPIDKGRFELTVVVDGPSTDPTAENRVRPRMVVEVIRHRMLEGIPQEEIVRDIDGNPAVCDDWSSDQTATNGTAQPKGIFFASDGGSYHWNALFTLDGPPDHDGWSHAVVVRETRELDLAQPTADTRKADTGPVFLARIPVKRSPP
ncbi:MULTISPECIES: hypothetical protein [Bradyrhizobium]|uniref:Uncharacterized protein n=2 Tax=Bradyrhizobium TaxID=374 RepID=A0ABY0PM39_9BRAD|nr:MULTISPECIES: hypothetical protein [Bradyrhizobium]SDI63341.1 hypothetical protein SAMN05444163_3315 [Bradyrhizobium ottawaense]SED34273.1 hypothetical protein SAMN05444171_3853 [Bradyrhizobium lablabi]